MTDETTRHLHKNEPETELAQMPNPKYRVLVRLYPVDEPDATVLKEDWPVTSPHDIEAAAAVVARRAPGAIYNYEAANQ
jgi:hypothetical protein